MTRESPEVNSRAVEPDEPPPLDDLSERVDDQFQRVVDPVQSGTPLIEDTAVLATRDQSETTRDPTANLKKIHQIRTLN